jgi:hypothetical protein
MHSILITGRDRIKSDGENERSTINRALYSGWGIVHFESDGSRFVAVLAGLPGLDPEWQIGRLQSFGTWGVLVNPRADDIDAALKTLYA